MILIAVLAAMLCVPALAESYTGTIIADTTAALTAGCEGTVTGLNAAVGQMLSAGDTVCTLNGTRVFAPCDGTVSLISCGEGETASGTVMELTPTGRYDIRCTVSKAYAEPETERIRCGETLYVSCTKDGSHLAFGTVVKVSGSEYTVYTFGGELQVGETVYLYRDPELTKASRTGIGTVLERETIRLEGDGILTRKDVSEGEQVQRGELLYVLDGGTITSDAYGILTELNVKEGDRVTDGQTIGTVAETVCVSFSVSAEAAAAIREGDLYRILPANDPQEHLIDAYVSELILSEDGGDVTVHLSANGEYPIGLTVTVFGD